MRLSILSVHQAIPVGKTQKVVSSVSVDKPQFKGYSMTYENGVIQIKAADGAVTLVFPTNVAYAIPKDVNGYQGQASSEGVREKAERTGKASKV